MQNLILPFLLAIILLPQLTFASSNTGSENLQLKIITGQKLKGKIDEIFAHTPGLLATYNKIQNTELSKISNLPEYQVLLNSKELKTLNNSPEMQEAIKEVINDINTQIYAINQGIDSINAQANKSEEELNEQNQAIQAIKGEILTRELKKTIYAKSAVVNELKKGISNALQTFNKQQKLYFADAKAVNNISELTPIQKPDTLTTNALLTSLINLDQLIDTRITTAATIATNLEDFIFSAGDEYIRDEYAQDGLWIKGFKSYAKQSEYKLTQGYKSDGHGVVIGLDFIDQFIGVAYAFIQDRVNSNISGTKEVINSHIATIYSLCKFNNTLFIDIQARYGRSYINKSRNNLNLSNNISHAKTKGDIYGGKLELGYDYLTQGNIHVVPSIGAAYDELRIERYQEKGAGLNRKVEARTVNKTTALLGVRISKAIEVKSFIMIPEIHIKSLHTFSANNDKTTITILKGAEPLVTPSNKLPKTIYKIGGSLKTDKSQPLDVEIGYDFSKSKKFHSHTMYISAIIAF